MCDVFAKKPQLRLPNGEKKYNTCCGTLCTLVYFAALILFAFYFWLCIGGNRSSGTLNHRTKLEERYGMSENELPIAFGIVDPEDASVTLDPNIATIKAYKRWWTYEAAIIKPLSYEEYSGTTVRECVENSSDDFEIVEPMLEAEHKGLEQHIEDMKCIDSVALVGDASALHGLELVFMLEVC